MFKSSARKSAHYNCYETKLTKQKNVLSKFIMSYLWMGPVSQLPTVLDPIKLECSIGAKMFANGKIHKEIAQSQQNLYIDLNRKEIIRNVKNGNINFSALEEINDNFFTFKGQA